MSLSVPNHKFGDCFHETMISSFSIFKSALPLDMLKGLAQQPLGPVSFLIHFAPIELEIYENGDTKTVSFKLLHTPAIGTEFVDLRLLPPEDKFRNKIAFEPNYLKWEKDDWWVVKEVKVNVLNDFVSEIEFENESYLKIETNHSAFPHGKENVKLNIIDDDRAGLVAVINDEDYPFEFLKVQSNYECPIYVWNSTLRTSGDAL